MKIQIMGWLSLALVVLLAACGVMADQEPTPDVAALRTQAVETAMAELTVQAAFNPTATPVPPTITPLPTATRYTLTPTAGRAATGGAAAGTAGRGDRKLPTLTPTFPPWSSDDYRCRLEDQYPYDQAQKAGSEYVIVWTIRNIGKRTWWNINNSVVWQGEDDISPYNSYNLSHKEVEPGQTVDVRVDIHLPTNPQDQMLVTNWGIINHDGDVFCRFFHAIPRLF